MTKLIASILLCLSIYLVAQLAAGEPGEDLRLLARPKRAHSGALTKPSNSQRKALNDVIDMWSFPYSENRGKTKTLFEKKAARIDIQKPSRADVLDLYNAQIAGDSYASVHLERNYPIGADMIREAFRSSMNGQAHVFITKPGARINLPNDGTSYVSREIVRNLPGNKKQHFQVWSSAPVVDALRRKFDNTKLDARPF